MNLSGLPVDLEEFIQRELAQGTYRSEAELVADAVRLLREHHQSREGLWSKNSNAWFRQRLQTCQRLLNVLISSSLSPILTRYRVPKDY